MHTLPPPPTTSFPPPHFPIRPSSPLFTCPTLHAAFKRRLPAIRAPMKKAFRLQTLCLVGAANGATVRNGAHKLGRHLFVVLVASEVAGALHAHSSATPHINMFHCQKAKHHAPHFRGQTSDAQTQPRTCTSSLPRTLHTHRCTQNQAQIHGPLSRGNPGRNTCAVSASQGGKQFSRCTCSCPTHSSHRLAKYPRPAVLSRCRTQTVLRWACCSTA